MKFVTCNWLNNMNGLIIEPNPNPDAPHGQIKITIYELNKDKEPIEELEYLFLNRRDSIELAREILRLALELPPQHKL